MKAAVLISDVHYNVHTIKLADAAMRQAINKANSLDLPLIIAGDLHDTKANLRGECVEAMLNTLELAKTKVYIIVGNHDLINEKSTNNALEFLRGTAELITHPRNLGHLHLFPYFSDSSVLVAELNKVPKGSTIIMHQGVNDANSGEYAHDKSALSSDIFDGYRVISGHYHARQTIQCGTTGIFDYIGNPYTLTFGESQDPAKGYQILNSDGTLEFVPTNLRKHTIVDLVAGNDIPPLTGVSDEDLVWVKISGTKEQLATVSKRDINEALGRTAYKLDLFPIAQETTIIASKQDAYSLLDTIIDDMRHTTIQRERVKLLWRELNEKT